MRSYFRKAKNLGFVLGPRRPHAEATCIPKAPRHRSDRCQPQGPQGLAMGDVPILFTFSKVNEHHMNTLILYTLW